MKKCNTEIMKEIKKLEEYKIALLNNERSSCTVTYALDEEPLESDYNFDLIDEKIEWYDNEIRRLKGLLAHSNVTTIVEGFNMTISEALIYLAQLKQKENRYDFLLSKKKLTRTSGYGDRMVEFTKILYDQDKIYDECAKLKEIIAQLQMAIDRTNLTNMIDC